MSPEFYMELAASTNSLEHHGVEGQKWGKRNGPPYPLDTTGREKLKRQKEALKNNAAVYDMYSEEAAHMAVSSGAIMGLIVGGMTAVYGAPALAIPVAALAAGTAETALAMGSSAVYTALANKNLKKVKNIQNILDQDALEKKITD